MIIDIHTHAWPEKVSQKAKENLETSFRVKLVGDPTLGTLSNFMDKNKIDISVVCAVATRPDQVPSINDWLFQIRDSRLRVFCALHPEYDKWQEELIRIRDNADGIKLQPEFQDFYIDDKGIVAIYESMQQMNIPVLFHCGKELSGTKLIRSSPDRLIKIRNQFPKLKIIAAHFGGFEIWQDVERYLLGKDIYFDTAFFFNHLPKEEIKRLILAHPDDRILFGTDFPLIDQKEDIEFLEQLDIPAKLKERIFSLNARELLGI